MRESQTALSSYEAALLRGVAAGADPATLAKNLKRGRVGAGGDASQQSR
jgi:hypothetical protein